MKKTAVKARTSSALQFALEFEAKGVQMYMKLALECENALGKKLFYSLAAEEIEHAKRIDQLYNTLKGRTDFKNLATSSVPSVESKLRDFYTAAIKSKTDLTREKGSLKGYELAMKMERTGYKAYSDFFAAAQSEVEKAFFAQMMKEENGHLEALANVYSYLTNTDDWLQEEESKVWNWMNI